MRNTSTFSSQLNLSKLQSRFQDLEPLYCNYQSRIQVGIFMTFLLIQILVALIYFGWIVYHGTTTTTTETTLEEPHSTYDYLRIPEVVGQLILAFLSLVFLLLLRDRHTVKDKPRMLIGISLAFSISFQSIDFALLFIHQMNSDSWSQIETSSFSSSSKIPILSHLNHLIIYLFLPITQKRILVLFGFLSSIMTVSLTLALELYTGEIKDSTGLVTQMIMDFIYFLTLNFTGFFMRYVGEINMRRGFLDKKECIETTFKLRYEKEQEENLLLSIIPKHIATKVRDGVWNYVERERIRTNDEPRMPFNELFVERHENVSILFADICNFTPLTTKLSVEKLVETLNELFGQFDECAKVNKCMRIKILGDCYYCISGAPEPDESHASNCVNMGLGMIHLIKRVKRDLGVPVDMRIGLHSGFVLSGLIGLRKWQYDIWSKDVILANLMESTGKPGAIHITECTKTLLKDFFPCESLNIKDPLLEGRKTYLIYPKNKTSVLRDVKSVNEISKGIFVSPVSQIIHRNHQPIKEHNLLEDQNHRRSLLMDSSLKNFQKLKNSAGEFLKTEIEKLPVQKSTKLLTHKAMNPFLLCFKNWSCEKLYLNESDPLFKYYILASYVLLISIVTLSLLSEKYVHFPVWINYTILFVLLSFLLPLLWISYIWDTIVDPYLEDQETIQEPSFCLLKWYYSKARIIHDSYCYRTLIYSTIVTLMLLTSVIDSMTVQCLSESPRNYTYRSALAFISIFLFLRIHHCLKILCTVLALLFYGIVILSPSESKLYFSSHNIFNMEYFGYNELFSNSEKNKSHFLYLCVFALFFYIVDRQKEFMHRLDYQWKIALKEEQEKASDTKLVNKTLLQNILPHHIAEVYLLDKKRDGGKLYSEEYRCVAVMFASFPQFMDLFTEMEKQETRGGGEKALSILNTIISSFDKLMFLNEFNRIEKIKVISSTYMAACGLHPGRKGSNESDSLEDSNESHALTMVKFGAALMKELQTISQYNPLLCSRTKFQLRIGLTVGPVIAGVIGAQKPLYDIWGNTVNVASRMDYTGTLGHIQVPKSTASILGKQGVSCTYRDLIAVKGKGKMALYYVDIDSETFEVVMKNKVMIGTQEKKHSSDDSFEESDCYDEEPPLNYKKDSGYESQGQLKVDKILTQMSKESSVKKESDSNAIQETAF